MDSLLIAALAFSLSQILLSVVLFIRIKRTWSIQQGLYGVFLMAVTAYLLTPLVESPWLSVLMGGLQTLVPGTFWLFTASLFEDHFKLRFHHYTLVGITVLAPMLGSALSVMVGDMPRWLFWTLPQTLEFVLIGLAMWSVIRYWRDDLVESRRDLRLWFCGLIGLYIVTLLLLRELLFPGAAWLSVWQYVPVCGVLLLTNGLLLEHKTGLFHPPTARPAIFPVPAADATLAEPRFASVSGANLLELSNVVDSEPTHVVPVSSSEPEVNPSVPEMAPESSEPVPEALLDQLTELMEEERVYREMGLTIGQLAVRLELPEYRLRRIINAGLGYRNFNDFLNTYRIREASQRLMDPAELDEAVLNIALDAGFRSLSSFNKAFKQAFAKTPTEYRAAHHSGETSPS